MGAAVELVAEHVPHDLLFEEGAGGMDPNPDYVASGEIEYLFHGFRGCYAPYARLPNIRR